MSPDDSRNLSPSVPPVPTPDSEEEDVVLEIFRPSEVLFPHRNQNDLVIIVSPPGRAVGSALTQVALERAALANQLHTERPTKVVTAIDSKRNRLYLMPVARSDGPDAIPVRYLRTGFQVNLYNHLGPLDKLVPEGERHIYRCEVTKKRITIGEFQGIALYIDLDSAAVESARRQSRKAGADAAPSTSATSTAPSGSTVSSGSATPSASDAPTAQAAAPAPESDAGTDAEHQE